MSSQEPVPNRVAVAILRHPQEQDVALGTAKILTGGLRNVMLSTGLSWPNAKAALGRKVDNRKWAVLYLGSHKISGDRILTFLDREGTEIVEDEKLRSSIEGVIVLDGSWSQAKTLWWRNPWLLKMQRIVINPFTPSLYGKLRKEPRRESVSTLEAVAAAMVELGEPVTTAKMLLQLFREMLAAHREERKKAPPRPPRRRPEAPRKRAC